eukprot:gene10766-17853_t
MSILKFVQRRWRTFRRKFAASFWNIFDFLWFLAGSAGSFFFDFTLPVTKRFLSRFPKPPRVTVKDIRANRIRLNIENVLSSPFNVEQNEIEWRPKGTEVWTSVGWSDLTQRTVARLPGDSQNEFRVRTKNVKGTSDWCPVVSAKTRLDPKDGGGYGEGYIWAQTSTDVTITIKALPAATKQAILSQLMGDYIKIPTAATKRDILLQLKGDYIKMPTAATKRDILLHLKGEYIKMPTAATKRDILLQLKGDYIKVEILKPPSGTSDAKTWVALEGKLYGKAASFENGSFWELVKDEGELIRILTLEKAVRSIAPKFDCWRSIQSDHPELEIDTHCIEHQLQ